MARISKPPEIRKKEILDAAMRLFYEKGYEATSMADIAKELHVVQGLCYRYFASKQELFQTAMEQYVIESCRDFIPILHDQSLPLLDRLDTIYGIFRSTERKSEYHSFYHKPENENLHLQLSLKIGEYLSSHVEEELLLLCEKGALPIEHLGSLLDFITYGQVGVLLGPHSSHRKHQHGSNQDEIKHIRSYIATLIGMKE